MGLLILKSYLKHYSQHPDSTSNDLLEIEDANTYKKRKGSCYSLILTILTYYCETYSEEKNCVFAVVSRSLCWPLLSAGLKWPGSLFDWTINAEWLRWDLDLMRMIKRLLSLVTDTTGVYYCRTKWREFNMSSSWGMREVFWLCPSKSIWDLFKCILLIYSQTSIDLVNCCLLMEVVFLKCDFGCLIIPLSSLLWRLNFYELWIVFSRLMSLEVSWLFSSMQML